MHLTVPAPPPDIAAHAVTMAFEACSAQSMTLGSLIEATARRHADRPAVAFEGGTILYRDLLARIRALAKGLVAIGAGKGTRVALLLTNRPEFVIATYAIALVGGVTVPIHSVSTAREREYMLAHSDAAILVLQAAFRGNRYLDELVEAHPEIRTGTSGSLEVAALPFLRRVVCLTSVPSATGIESWGSLIERGTPVSGELLDACSAAVDPADDAVIIYTSGSTGRPKGVIQTHRAACLQQWRARIIYTMAKDERVWSVNPLFWSAGYAFFLGTLAAGACMVMQESMEPAATLELIERERVTMLASAVTTLAALADHPDAARRDLSSIRHLPTEAALRRHLDVAEKVWGPTVAWGQSETFASCTYVIHGADSEPLDVPGGYPMPGMTIRIVDAETGIELPRGETGEIAVKGAQLMRGYVKKLPEECFDAEGFVRTKDSGFIDARGRLHFTGRLSNLIRTRGTNVSPLDVEAAIVRWGGAKTAFVIGIPDERLGEAVVACIVPRDDQAAPSEALLKALRGDLASYKLPRHVVVFADGEIPMTGSNKPQLAALRELAIERIGLAA